MTRGRGTNFPGLQVKYFIIFHSNESAKTFFNALLVVMQALTKRENLYNDIGVA